MTRWDAPGNMDCARSWMPSSISCEPDAPGVRCPTGRRRAARSTSGSAAWPTAAGWRRCHALLLAVRELQGHEASSTLGIIDSQTVKVMAPAGPRGYDNAKKINGRKRHILVDSLGHLLAVLVTDGAVQDRDGGIDLVRQVQALFPWIVLIAADSAYTGRFEAAMARLNIAVEIVRRPQFAKGFVLLPKRWRVEQTFGVARFCRRLLVDHETLPHVSESMIRMASIMRFATKSNQTFAAYLAEATQEA